VTDRRLTYAVVTPVRNEAANVRRVAESLASQSLVPDAWVLVDTGSTDDTRSIIEELGATHEWITATSLDQAEELVRGGPIVRAFELGLATLPRVTDVVVKLDADTSFDPPYFERLIGAFAADETLGMASGTCYELEDGEWRERHVTGTTVWGASRAYRRACLEDVRPLEHRMGWDGVDEFRANSRGWKTRTLKDLPFRHHRREGERDGAPHRARLAQGRAARFLGYRLSYLALRAIWNARREPAALAMIVGYLQAAIHREPRLSDPTARAYLRRQQSIRRLPLRAAEAMGRRRNIAA
jgi:glycosyltransferase involved in cell wall biosynthesis